MPCALCTTLSRAYSVVILRRTHSCFPFEIGLNKPNAETLAAIREIEEMRSGLIPKQSLSVADFAREMGE
jgi:antitoxin component of RelBE/YafQ-DinJ toxin-antitoxin module